MVAPRTTEQRVGVVMHMGSACPNIMTTHNLGKAWLTPGATGQMCKDLHVVNLAGVTNGVTSQGLDAV